MLPAQIVELLLLLLMNFPTVVVATANRYKPHLEKSYHGVIVENSDMVLLDPPLVALDRDAPSAFTGEICAFRLSGTDVPFESVLLNRTSGEGLLRAKRPMDCEQKFNYSFTVQAYDCGCDAGGTGRRKSHRAEVHIQVEDVNEFAPVFRESLYSVEVREGRSYQSILQVEATDADCSPQYGHICSYAILTTHTPFIIDKTGNIRNTQPLSSALQPQHQILVTAFDCGKKSAVESAVVHINVKPECHVGWKGWDKRVDFDPGSISLQPFPRMQLDTCGGKAVASTVTVTVELQMGKGCDINDDADESLRDLCVAAASVDLLPPPTTAGSWTALLPTETGRYGDVTFQFNGRQVMSVPEGVALMNLTHRFDLSTWMKHGLRRERETLLCSCGRTGDTWRHISLRVHQCRLEFQLQSKEFSWRLEQVCDEQWHFYLLRVDAPYVTLLVDSVSHEPQTVTETVPHSYRTQLSIGACGEGVAMGAEATALPFTHHFRGSLSGLCVRPRGAEPRQPSGDTSCQQACGEGLDFFSTHSLSPSLRFHFNHTQSTLMMESEDVRDLITALGELSYINTLRRPTAGPRRLRISTAVRCSGEEPCLSVPHVEMALMVMAAGAPRVTLSSPDHVAGPAADLRSSAGVLIFSQLHISNNRTQTLPASDLLPNLDSCSLLVMGEKLNLQHESLQLHHSLGNHLRITNSSSGISIYGVDSTFGYEKILRQVSYHNRYPGGVPSRRFRLTCWELVGHYSSNQLYLEVNIIYSSTAELIAAHVAVESAYKRAVHAPVALHGGSSNSAGPSIAVAVVVAACISALVVIVVVGVYRIHTAHQESYEEEDDVQGEPTLNITVNPMEKVCREETRLQEDASEVSNEETEILEGRRKCHPSPY